MCDTANCCSTPCAQKFPSQKRTIVLSPAFLNAQGNGGTGSGAKIYLQLPFCVNECQSNCNLNFCDFHFVAICLKDHCHTTYQNLNDPDCNGGELSEDGDQLFSLTQLPNTRVTLSRVGICLENTTGTGSADATAAWNALKLLLLGSTTAQFKGCLELCIEYWVECSACCTAEETTVPAVT